MMLCLVMEVNSKLQFGVFLTKPFFFPCQILTNTFLIQRVLLGCVFLNLLTLRGLLIGVDVAFFKPPLLCSVYALWVISSYLFKACLFLCLRTYYSHLSRNCTPPFK